MDFSSDALVNQTERPKCARQADVVACATNDNRVDLLLRSAMPLRQAHPSEFKLIVTGARVLSQDRNFDAQHKMAPVKDVFTYYHYLRAYHQRTVGRVGATRNVALPQSSYEN
jgi:hypothetical protein